MVSLDKQGMFPLWELGRWRAGEVEFVDEFHESLRRRHLRPESLLVS